MTFKKTGNADFKGVFIEARKAKDTSQNIQYGTYNIEDSNLKLVQCRPNHNVGITYYFTDAYMSFKMSTTEILRFLIAYAYFDV